MTNPILLNKCPNCNGLAAVASNPHCTRNPKCTWNVCSCGHTYDRHTGTHFHTDPQRPGSNYKK